MILRPVLQTYQPPAPQAAPVYASPQQNSTFNAHATTTPQSQTSQQQSTRPDVCIFCSDPTHYQFDCAKAADYIQRGLMMRNSTNQLVLPNGRARHGRARRRAATSWNASTIGTGKTHRRSRHPLHPPISLISRSPAKSTSSQIHGPYSRMKYRPLPALKKSRSMKKHPQKHRRLTHSRQTLWTFLGQQREHARTTSPAARSCQ